MRKPLLLTFLLALAIAVVTAPAQAVGKRCDLTGDSERANDCITHSHVGATADGNMRRGETITIRPRIADALRGSALVVEVQMRRVSRDGRKGPWVGLRRTRWTAAETAAHATRTIDVCRAGVAGRYEFRTAIPLPRAASTGRTLRQGAMATSSSTTVTLPNRAAGGCPNSPEDEEIIEYFNQIEFEQDFYVLITDQGTSLALQLNCPPQQTSTFPPSDFGLVLAIEGAAAGIGCNSGVIVLDKSTLAGKGYAACTTSSCTFDVLAYNKTTSAVYSDTLLQIAFTGMLNSYTPTASAAYWPVITYIPDLMPATLPLCPATFNPCVLTGTCTLSTTKAGTLSLCDSDDSDGCTPPPTNSTYSYNDNVYFQTVVSAQG